MFTTNDYYGPFYVSFNNNVRVDIIVKKLGINTEKIGFVVRTDKGFIQFQWISEFTFSSNSILGSFVPNGLNLSPVADVSG